MSIQKVKNKESEVEHYEMAVKFQQKSAEVYALQIQGYNMATKKLNDYMKNEHQPGKKKPAVVVDLDETVLNNMPFVAMGIEEGFDYTKWGAKWSDWVEAACAETIPGSKDFLMHADRLGVKIFYISNRLTEEEDATIKNLKKLDLPQVTKDNVLLRGDRGTKKDRRASIKQDHEIVVLVGNSLYDLSSVFINESTDEQIKIVEDHADLFGDRFIILPNSSYGDYWVDAPVEAWKE